MPVKTLAEVMGMNIDDRFAYLRSMTPEQLAEANEPWKKEWREACAQFRRDRAAAVHESLGEYA